MEQIVGRDGRGPGAVVMKTYEIYSIWADAITPPPPPTDHPPPLVGSLHTAHLCEQVLVTRICVYIYMYIRIGWGIAMVEKTARSSSRIPLWKFQWITWRGDCHDAGRGTERWRGGGIGGFLGGIRWIGMADPRFVTTISADGGET